VFAGAYKKAAKLRFSAPRAEGNEPKFNGSFYQTKEKKSREAFPKTEVLGKPQK
jgi:hypothetical protein